MAGLESIGTSTNDGQESGLLDVSDATSDVVLKLLEDIEDVREIKDEFLSAKLTEIFNTKYLNALFAKLVEFHSGAVENARAIGISILSEDDINRELEIRKIASNYRFIVSVDTTSSVANIKIGIKDLSIDIDDILSDFVDENTKYIGESLYFLDDFMTKDEWRALLEEVFNEYGILIIDKEEFWRK